MKKHYRHHHDCLNCGSDLHGKFCHNCGQENLEIKESFGHMFTHAVSDYFHFDQQFFHTLKPLLFKPGKLTLDYLAGRRAQYLHPVKMYIFISLVYFLLLFKSTHEKKEKVKHEKAGSKKEKAAHADTTKKGKAIDDDEEVNVVVGNGKHTVTVKGSELATPITIKGVDALQKAKIEKNIKKEDTTYAQYLESEAKLPPDERDGMWERFYNKSSFAYIEKYGKERAKDMFMEDLKHNIPKMMFFMLPLFALILKIAFFRNHKFYVEHLIYAIHLHCFFFLLFTLLRLIKLPMPDNWDTITDIFETLTFIWSVWYVYRSFRVVYHRSRWRTISKMCGITTMYFFTFIFCITCLALITMALAG